MKRVLLLVLIAIGTFVVFALFRNPGVLEDIWLWIVGLIGLIIKTFRSVVDYIKGLFAGDDKGKQGEEPTPSPSEQPVAGPLAPSADINISLLRYSDDGQTTIGLLHINDKFYCYTLEDTFQEEKVAGQTRIPAGTYTIGFRKEETELTETYRERYPEWFTNHLHIKEVPNFSAIYIHSGGDHTHTEGCVLVSDSLSAKDKKTYLTNSRNTFKTLYKYLSDQLQSGKKIQIHVRDEGWSKQLTS